ncbi:MAG: phosphoglycerate mutase family protein [Ferruginibacter sp.]
MRHLFCFVTLLLIFKTASAQLPEGLSSKTKIYLVRHAEKDTGNNPQLTAAGRKRAGDLLHTLQNKKIERIYATQYKRTQQTGDSLRIQLHIDTLLYKADTTGESILNKIIAAGDGGKTILIIGHSNTIPKIIRKLGAADFPSNDIPDAVFDNLYLLTYKKGKAVMKEMKYGAASGSSATMRPLQ